MEHPPTLHMPLPVPPDTRRVVLFGGSFDPPHEGHIGLGLAARAAHDPDERAWLVYVPAARSPHKQDAPGASGVDRVRMLALAIGDAPRTSVWEEELRRADADDAGASYWIDTARAARASLDDRAEVLFVIGADQVLAFPRWRDWREILEIATPVVLLRDGQADADGLVHAIENAPAWQDAGAGAFGAQWWGGRVVRAPLVPGSSTEIRDALARGDADITGLAHRVRAYIEERGLYRLPTA